MIKNIVFCVLCTFLVPPILLPGGRGNMVASEITCPSDSKPSEEPVTTPKRPNEDLLDRIYSKRLNAKRHEMLTASEDVYIKLDAESIYCYEREEQLILEAFATLWWNDTLICWDPAEYGNVNNVSFQNGFIYEPRLISYTKSIETFRLSHHYSDCVVFSNGTVMCRYILFMTGECKMELYNWPIASVGDCQLSLEIFNPTGRQRLIHRDNRDSWEWLSSANMGNPGEFIVYHVLLETDGKNGVVYRFFLQGTTTAFAHALTVIAAVLSIVLASSFWLPAGSAARMSLLGCACVSLLMSIGFLNNQLSSVTPDAVRLHSDILLVAAVALIPATLLAPRLTPTKPYTWQIRLRSWLLSSSIGQFLLLILRVPAPVDKDVSLLGEDGQQSTSFQKEDSASSSRDGDSTRALLFLLADRATAVICSICLMSIWIAMFIITVVPILI